MVTTNSQVPFLVTFFSKNNAEKEADMGNDIVATKVTGGSQEYMKWVRQQVGSKFSSESSSSGGSSLSLAEGKSDADEELIGDLPNW